MQWQIGWLKGLLRDPLSFDDDLDELYDCTDARIGQLESCHLALMDRVEAGLPSAQVGAKRIGIPLKAWPGNCHAIAAAVLKEGMLRHLEGDHGFAHVAYGLYAGPIAETGHFAGRGITHHGWVEFDSGLVVDPTAWVFTDTAPALKATTIADYDLAGSRFRSSVSMRPAPAFDPAGRTFLLPADEKDALATAGLLLGAARDWDGRVGLGQMMWLANLPLERLGSEAKSLYRAIAVTGNAAMIPIDNRIYVEEAVPPEPSPAP
ncbi:MULTISPECIES: hypothetical protein [unclassified Bradyrhizobium]